VTTFTDLVGVSEPLQLAGMGGGISDATLACAVCDAGGLGMLGGTGPTPIGELLDAMGDRTFGVNFLMPFLDRSAVAAAASRAKVVEFFYGDPSAELVDLVHDGGALAAWQVGSADEARQAVAAGCDFIVVQGTEAGGHVRGRTTLDELLASIDVDVPVVAAGGIGTAERVADVMARGASGVRVGTRFIAAKESSAHPLYVGALIGASSDDTVLTEAFSVGWPNAPHRVLRSCVEAAESSEDETVATLRTPGGDVPLPRFGTIPPTKGCYGRISAMALYAGTSVDAVQRREPAADIVAELTSNL
jgi:NAD(P)H-dependent flavin oxidoreductase YrpB (nitropropane dioxygenase family)